MTAQWDALPSISTAAELAALGIPIPTVRDKARSELDSIDIDWLAQSPLVFVGTANADGQCDVSPKGDPPGFAKALDSHTVVIPERAGNKRMDGFHNILLNPHVGLNFLIPGRGDTLRINGRARIVTDGPFFDDLVVHRHRPAVALLVHVETVFFHCAKAFLRSQTWDPSTWDPTAVPSTAAISQKLVHRHKSLAELEEYYGAQYARSLYPPSE